MIRHEPLEYAFSLGAQCDAEMTLLHVLEQPASKAGPQTERAAVLQQLEQVIPFGSPNLVNGDPSGAAEGVRRKSET
jgi:hypothetical protein